MLNGIQLAFGEFRRLLRINNADSKRLELDVLHYKVVFWHFHPPADQLHTFQLERSLVLGNRRIVQRQLHREGRLNIWFFNRSGTGSTPQEQKEQSSVHVGTV